MNTEVNNNLFKFIKMRIVYNSDWRNSEDDYRPAYNGPDQVRLDPGDVAMSKDPQDRIIIFVGTKLGVLVIYPEVQKPRPLGRGLNYVYD